MWSEWNYVQQAFGFLAQQTDFFPVTLGFGFVVGLLAGLKRGSYV